MDTHLQMPFLRASGRLPSVLTTTTVLGLMAALLVHGTGSRLAHLSGALTALGALVVLPRVGGGGRLLACVLALVGLYLVVDRTVPALVVVAAVLPLTVTFGAGASLPRVALAAVGPALAVSAHAWLVHLVRPWSPATQLLAGALEASVGLFLGLGLALAHLEGEDEHLAWQLDLRDAGTAWRRLTAALGKQRRTGARRQLEARLRGLARQLITQTDEVRAVAAAITGVDEKQLHVALAELSAKAEAVMDTQARRHLEQALRAHRDTLEQVDGLTRRRERLEARARATLALLERAALALEATSPTEPLGEVVARLDLLAGEA